MDTNAPGWDERKRVIAALDQAGWVQATAAKCRAQQQQTAYRAQTLDIQVK